MAESKKATERRANDPEAATQVAQKQADVETEDGLRGVEVDSTPNEHYTVSGVLAGKPVPEASDDPAAARREASNP
jgi:hypothetical protein